MPVSVRCWRHCSGGHLQQTSGAREVPGEGEGEVGGGGRSCLLLPLRLECGCSPLDHLTVHWTSTGAPTISSSSFLLLFLQDMVAVTLLLQNMVLHLHCSLL